MQLDRPSRDIEHIRYNYGQMVHREFYSSDDLSRLGPGDVLGVERIYVVCPYVHYGIYAGNGRIIHYAPKDWKGDDSFAGWDIKSCRAALKNAWNYNYEIKRNDIPADVAELVEKLKKVTDIVSENVADAQDCYIHEAPFSEFLGQFMGKATRKFFVLRFNEERWKAIERIELFSLAQTHARALARIGESDYKLTSNNCEHFAMWCRTGLSTSRQAQMIEELLQTYLAEPLDEAGDLWQEHAEEIRLFLGQKKPVVEQKLDEAGHAIEGALEKIVASVGKSFDHMTNGFIDSLPKDKELRQKILELLGK